MTFNASLPVHKHIMDLASLAAEHSGFTLEQVQMLTVSFIALGVIWAPPVATEQKWHANVTQMSMFFIRLSSAATATTKEEVFVALNAAADMLRTGQPDEES